MGPVENLDLYLCDGKFIFYHKIVLFLNYFLQAILSKERSEIILKSL